MSSAKEEYKEEDVVFAMVTGYPWWPGYIAERFSRKQYKVTFFGDFSYAELSVKQIKSFKRGLKRVDPSNKPLVFAVQSAKKVVEGKSTIEAEHEIVKEKMQEKEDQRKTRKTKAITKKKKSSRRLKASKRAEKLEKPEKNDRLGKARTKRKLRLRGKEKEVSQSMIQDPTYKRRGASQKKREAKLGRSMDEKMIEESCQEDEEDEGRMILEELEEQCKEDEDKGEEGKKDGEGEEQGSKGGDVEKEVVVVDGQETGENIKEDTPDEEVPKNKNGEKEESPIVDCEEESKMEPKEPSEKMVESKSLKSIKEEEKQEAKSEKKKEDVSPLKSIENIQPTRQENSENKENQENPEPPVPEEIKGQFCEFEKDLLTLLNEMQGNQPIPKIEKNLKDWFTQISQVTQFSSIVSTNIGKYLSKMTTICQERISEKQIYNKILNDITFLKTFIIKRITTNFFNMDQHEEAEQRMQNEDSIVTTKKNESTSKMGRMNYPEALSISRPRIASNVRLRIQKKLAKRISKMAARNSIKKETCLRLGKRIEEFLNQESNEVEELYREYVIQLLEYMDSAQKKFIDEFIFQKGSKCDVQVLRRKIKALLGRIN